MNTHTIYKVTGGNLADTVDIASFFDKADADALAEKINEYIRRVDYSMSSHVDIPKHLLPEGCEEPWSSVYGDVKVEEVIVYCSGLTPRQLAGQWAKAIEALKFLRSVCGEDEQAAGCSPEQQHQIHKAFILADTTIAACEREAGK